MNKLTHTVELSSIAAKRKSLNQTRDILDRRRGIKN